jgi:aminoglycoside 6'-N-acetyltransferase I
MDRLFLVVSVRQPLLKSALMAATDFAVRPLRETDLDEWFRLRKALWDVNDEQEHRSEMLDILGHPETQLVLVAEHGNGRAVGFLEASIRPFAEDCETDQVGYIEGWFIEEPYRRNGIGRELISAAEEWARQKGCTEMASDVEIGNEQSLAAQSGLGYQETSLLVHLRKELN